MVDRIPLSSIRTLSEGLEISAASTLPEPALPKSVKATQQSLPSYLRNAKPSSTSPLILVDRQLANTDITALRYGQNSRTIIPQFVRANPELSAAVTAYVRVGITSGYTAIAKNLDGTVNPDATSVLAQLLARLDVLNDYTIGFDDSLSLRSLSEVWARELMYYGAMAGELVLDQARIPSKIQPVNVAQIRLFPSKDAKRMVPQQYIAGQQIWLDYPTFFMVSLDQDTTDPYAISPIEPAIQGVLFSAEFMNDLRRVVKRAIHPRVTVTINEEKFKDNIPLEIKNDSEKTLEFMKKVINDVADQVNGLAPEDALVVFDSLTFKVADHGNTNLSNEYDQLQAIADAKIAAGAKTLPTVLGKSDGTSNVASTEALMFMKYVEGAVWSKLNEMISKMLTLGVRLMGQDVYVEFRYNPINLRPEVELESFRAMEQSRVLEQLSLGLITDEEASIKLTGHLPPAGYVNKSGTLFKVATAQPAGNGYNGETNSGSTLNQNLNGNAPKGAKSKNQTKAEIISLIGQ